MIEDVQALCERAPGFHDQPGVADASRRLPAVFSVIEAAGGEVRGTTLTQPSLESLFIKLTGKELRE